ncbi:unknown [Candidatus Colimorpha enterica]|uniref:Uncharacterized protein n=1 Tax=Candidatus Colimorpha enterica TaxID=3083063 RepID=R6TEN1_9BACT|nr:unknown [Candidatus Colimorpha enterica]
MIYNDRNSVKNMIQYSRQLTKKYKNEISLYDPTSQSSLATYSMDTSSSKFFRVTKEIEALPKPDRLQISAIGYPLSLGPGFAAALAVYLTREIEARTGIRGIHKIRGIVPCIKATLASTTYRTDDTFQLTEEHDGILYTYFVVHLFIRNLWLPTKKAHFGDKRTISPIWVKCHDTVRADRQFDFNTPDRIGSTPVDDDTENVVFEICDSVPQSFPPYDRLPEEIRKEYESFNQSPHCYGTGQYEDFLEKIYDANAWIEDVRSYLSEVIDFNNQTDARMVRLKDSEERRGDRKIRISYDKAGCERFPHILYKIRFSENVTDTTFDDITDAIRRYDCRELVVTEYYKISEIGDNAVALDVEFTFSSSGEIKKFANELKNSVPYVTKIDVG